MLKVDSSITTVTPAWLIISTVLVLILRLGLIARELSAPPDPKVKIEWHAPASIDEEHGLDGKPVLYFFSTGWCGACRKLNRDSFGNKQIVAYVNENFVPIRVDDKSMEERVNSSIVQELEDRFRINAFPVLVVALPDGTYISHMLGASKVHATRTFLQNAMDLTPYIRAKQYLSNFQFAKAEALLANYLSENGWTISGLRCALRRYVALRFLKKDAEAREFLHTALSKCDSAKWPYAILRYLDGKLDRPALQVEAGDFQTYRVELHTYVGLDHYFNGKNEEARKELQWVLEKKIYSEWAEYKLAKYVVDKLESAKRGREAHLPVPDAVPAGPPAVNRKSTSGPD